ncbi:S-type pyocin domain-containing protein [Serratia sp. 2723]|uniref:S-type pyocin domain-containing protein n=1 Tax=unclassified Serratia (in: enterobacteria) TaxID=2647522 RepID=UPI003D20E604
MAYTFTTEEDPIITIILTPESSGVNVPSNTGNQNPVRIPNPIIVDPLPEDTSIKATFQYQINLQQYDDQLAFRHV